MEEFLMRWRSLRFQAWHAVLGGVAIVLGLVAYGAAVEHGATGGDNLIARAAVSFARIPSETMKVIRSIRNDHHPMHAKRHDRFGGASGFERFVPASGDPGLLALSRFDPVKQRNIVEIVDLTDGSVLNIYSVDEQYVHSQTRRRIPTIDLEPDRDRLRFGMVHPLVEPDGSIIFTGMSTAMVKLDACSQIEWLVDGAFHHAIEKDPQGNYWVPGVLYPHRLNGVSDEFRDDSLTKISPEGEILLERSLAEIVSRSGREYAILAPAVEPEDPLHLNDIQPVASDGPYWKAGDVFLSIRNLSAVALYRPSTDEIVWWRQGPWLMQHDVDVLNEREIAVFDNRANTHGPRYVVAGHNNFPVYNFETDEVTRPFDEAFRVQNIRSATQGRSELLPDGELFVEEQNHGRVLQMDRDGKLSWQYVNRGEDGKIYQVHWSRWIPPALAAQVRTSLAEKQCSAG
ncbi:arylsulfotransferase family protein [Parvularcula lutaonensis]|uniref:Arylsulfotransferase family protein n=1 Tax=Parvularcula lutaonensis TaxID=491923 RepID=A0ABV7MFL6_9PROT|nr:arylsulfotransferase family protein [Parvularcula lutaonensis]GGY55031.1 hypothetical protein GCM10007148_26000 [Parvularcula lutaonensis]